MTALSDACAKGDLTLVNLLLAQGEDATVKNMAVSLAVSCGHLAVVERLLQEPDVDVPAYSSAALQCAACNGHLAVVERLLQEPDVDVTAYHNSALSNAATKGYLAIVDIICETLRLQIVSDFYAALSKEDKGLFHENIKEDLKLKFKEAVYTKMGKKIHDFIEVKPLIKKKILQKTYQQYERQKTLHERIAKRLPLDILGYISDFDESLNQRPQIDYSLKEEPSGTQTNKQKENLIPKRNIILSQMHFKLYEYFDEKSKSPSCKLENNEINNSESIKFKVN
ncbi:MAG: ankyrin repeat protein [Francisellaceae bacterium]|nr:ankyrin repeat protein [Francisellaceae bacterium]